jgi:outer membrane protein assembly factor BamA
MAAPEVVAAPAAERALPERVVIEGLRQVPEGAVRKDLCLGTSRCGADDEAAVERDGLVIQANLYDLGYVQSNVARAEVRRRLDAVEVVYRVTEGERFRLKKISVSEPDPAARVRKQIKLPKMTAKDGDWFSRKVVAEDRSRIERVYRDAGYANVDVVVESDVGTEASRSGAPEAYRRDSWARHGEQRSANPTFRCRCRCPRPPTRWAGSRR